MKWPTTANGSGSKMNKVGFQEIKAYPSQRLNDDGAKISSSIKVKEPTANLFKSSLKIKAPSMAPKKMPSLHNQAAVAEKITKY